MHSATGSFSIQNAINIHSRINILILIVLNSNNDNNDELYSVVSHSTDLESFL